MFPQGNVTVKVDHRGRMKVFVGDTLMAGVGVVKYESLPKQCGTLHIEVIGALVAFEQLPRPEKEQAAEHEPPQEIDQSAHFVPTEEELQHEAEDTFIRGAPQIEKETARGDS